MNRRRGRRAHLLVAVLALLGTLGVGAALHRGNGPETKAGPADLRLGWARVPAVTLPPLAESTRSQLIEAAARDGRTARGPVLLNFWAGWCGPCVKELPLLQSASEELPVTVVGVSRDVRSEVAVAALDKAGVRYSNWFDPDADFSQQVARVVPPVAVPSTALVVDGRIIAVHIGPFESARDLRQYAQYTG